MKRASKSRFRILALDVDGTLLDRDGTLRPRTAEAVARAARAGIRPVLCTGRRYRRARPVAEQLGLDAPIVCNSGAIVKNPSGHRTLWRADFDAELLADVLELFREHEKPAVSFTDRDPDEFDFVVANAVTGRALFDEYVELNRAHAEVDPAGKTAARRRALPPLRDRTRSAMLAFQAAILAACRAGADVRPEEPALHRHDVRGPPPRRQQVVGRPPPGRALGRRPGEICAVGDDMNDVPMIAGAGLGVAMGHAPPDVLAAADLVTGDHDNDGVAVLVDDVLLA